MTTNSTPPGFIRLNSSISLHEPSQIQGEEENDNKLLILCLWMSASPKLILKYTNEYLKLFPKITIILIECKISEMFYKSTFKHNKLLKPALNIILNEKNKNKKIIAAIYSNGGSYNLIQLSKLFLKETNDGGNSQSLSIKSTLLDSCPGYSDLKSSIHVIYSTLPSSITKSNFLSTPTWLIIWLLIKGYHLIYNISGLVDPIKKIRNDLLDTNLFDLGKANSRNTRTFIYSREDESVSYKAVERFSDQAERKGWIVKRERFEGSNHVAHANLDKERYWGIIKEALDTDA
ncbi:uncharacterized protein I206_106561 [Kwoniella pini CBS 10737]|uniref:Indole-diterpene biosynthesis protein PaxU n=1 Tax=Kwoniella pini CBS 10737 TaxID=1296096 RepID=A0A1B9HTU2_9TREE|nr:uncharacterized protein I206_07548 [Kwoniella pini CBS 10737]OCF46693.1 hypothetical protein I206_07548 [Kwoniella pini CBS 10737]